MNEKSNLIMNAAAKKIAATFGVLGGLGGVVHGIGEVLQGNISPSGFFISSWAQGPIATYLDGDPAITLIPNLLITGILALVVSIATIIHSIVFINKKRHGKILILLSVIMLFVGGGVGPPVLALLAGVAALGVNSAYFWWRTLLHKKIRSVLAMLWPWIFAVCMLNGIFLVVGHVIAVYFFAPVSAGVFQNSFYISVVLVILSIITGIAYDISKQERKGG